MADAAALRLLAEAYERFIESLPPGIHEGVARTPERAAKALAEMTSGYDVDVPALFTDFDADGYDEMIAVTDIPLASLCEHHCLPFVGKAHVAYIPDKKIVGLSKIPRLVDAFSQRLQVQERLTMQIADALTEHLEPVGVMVVIEAVHSCAALRGVKKSGMVMRTSVARGAMRDKPETRAEALAMIRSGS